MTPHADKLGVVILPIVNFCHAGLMVEGFRAECLQLIIIGFFTTPIVPAEDPLGIGIDDKAVMISGVKEHAVGSFRADAVDG